VKLVLIWNNAWVHLDYANKEYKYLKVRGDLPAERGGMRH
jgi:hypothetical protein